MKTNFFTNLTDLNASLKFTMTITFQKEQNILTVSLLPINTADDKVSDKATKLIKPLILSGTPEELNSEFFNVIEKPLNVTKEFFQNTKEYLERKNFAEKQAQKEKDKKNEIKELTEKMEKIVKADDFNAGSKKGVAALNLAKKIKKIDPTNKKALDTIKDIETKTGQKALF